MNSHQLRSPWALKTTKRGDPFSRAGWRPRSKCSSNGHSLWADCEVGGVKCQQIWHPKKPWNSFFCLSRSCSAGLCAAPQVFAQQSCEILRVCHVQRTSKMLRISDVSWLVGPGPPSWPWWPGVWQSDVSLPPVAMLPCPPKERIGSFDLSFSAFPFRSFSSFLG